MTIEISAAIIISVLSLAFSIFMGVRSNKRTDTKDVEKNTETRTKEMAERIKDNAVINVKLDNIVSLTGEIRHDLSTMRDEIKDHDGRIIKVEESCKSAHHRLDGIEQRLNKEECDRE